MDVYAFESYQQAPDACLLDTVAPTFAGIASATPQNSGAMQANWLAATDPLPNIRYRVHIAPMPITDAALFLLAPTVIVEGVLQALLFTLNDQSTYLVKGQQYKIGVRAQDSVGNIDNNTATVLSTAIASGNLADVYQVIATDLETQVDKLETEVNTMETENNEFATNNTDFANLLNTLDSENNEFNTNNNNLVTNINNLETNINELSDLLDDIDVAANKIDAAAANTCARLVGKLSSGDTLKGKLKC